MQNFTRETFGTLNSKNPRAKFNGFFNKHYLPLAYITQLWFITSEDRVQGHGTRGIRINYSKGPKKKQPFLFTDDMAVKNHPRERPGTGETLWNS